MPDELLPVSSDDCSSLDDLRVLLFRLEEFPVVSDFDSSDPPSLASSPRLRDEVVDSPERERPRLPDFGDVVAFSSEVGADDCELAGGVRLGFGDPMAFGDTEALGAAAGAVAFGPAAGGAGLFSEVVAVVAPAVVLSPVVVVAPVVVDAPVVVVAPIDVVLDTPTPAATPKCE